MHSLWYKPPTSSNAKQSINYVFLCLSVTRREHSEVAIFPVVTANVVPLSENSCMFLNTAGQICFVVLINIG